MPAHFHRAPNEIVIGKFELKFRALDKNKKWLDTHTVEGSGS
jgi:hypothetical protein